MLTEAQYQDRKETLEGMSLSAIWGSSRPDDFVLSDHFPFEQQKTIFFWLLQRFMQEGKIRLANHGKFLEGSIEEQIQRFKEVFPEKEEDLYYGLWFTFDECPAGAVWVLDDGTLDWT